MIREIEESDKSENPITTITIDADLFIEIAGHFIHSCLSGYIIKTEKN